MKLVVRSGEREEQVEVVRRGHGFAVTVGDVVHEVDAAALGDGLSSLRIDGAQHAVAVYPVRGGGAGAGAAGHDGLYRVSLSAVLPPQEVEVLDPLTHLARKSRGGDAAGGRQQVRAMMPGLVKEVLVEEGAEVTVGQGVVVLEAMKMENEIVAEAAGVVSKIFVAAGEHVDGGEPLFEVE
jgi:biotin carboxyl carrier protein